MVSRSAAEFADKRADFKCWLWIIMLDHWDFVNGLYIFLTIYALLCSNVVVHLSDHNWVMVAQVDYYSRHNAVAFWESRDSVLRTTKETSPS